MSVGSESETVSTLSSAPVIVGMETLDKRKHCGQPNSSVAGLEDGGLLALGQLSLSSLALSSASGWGWPAVVAWWNRCRVIPTAKMSTFFATSEQCIYVDVRL